MGIGRCAGQRAQYRAAFQAVGGRVGGPIRTSAGSSSYRSGGVGKVGGIGGAVLVSALFAHEAKAASMNDMMGDGASSARAGANCMSDASPSAKSTAGGGALLFLLAITAAGMIAVRKKGSSE